jgi:uncharacterized OsmC-like protein
MSVESGSGAGHPAQLDGAPPDGVQPDGLWAQRVGTRRYEGHNSRGAVVPIGPVELDGVFTPSELLKIALAGCVGMSADHTLARRLGPQVQITVRVSGDKVPGQDRYAALTEELHVDLSSLAEPDREQLITVARRAVDRSCTVGRTLRRGAEVELAVVNTP